MVEFGENLVVRFIRKNGIRFLVILCSILIFIGVFLLEEYFRNFHHGYSKDSNDWANFGQYISGVFSIVLSFLNLLILIYIAYTGYKGDQHRWETDLRIGNFKELVKELGKVNSKKNSSESIIELKEYLEITDLNNYYYLTGESETVLGIIQNKLVRCLSEAYDLIINSNPNVTNINQKKIDQHLDDFFKAKNDLIKMLGSIIMRRKAENQKIVNEYLMRQNNLVVM
jgi:hypothetical protein